MNIIQSERPYFLQYFLGNAMFVHVMRTIFIFQLFTLTSLVVAVRTDAAHARWVRLSHVDSDAPEIMCLWRRGYAPALADKMIQRIKENLNSDKSFNQKLDSLVKFEVFARPCDDLAEPDQQSAKVQIEIGAPQGLEGEVSFGPVDNPSNSEYGIERRQTAVVKFDPNWILPTSTVSIDRSDSLISHEFRHIVGLDDPLDKSGQSACDDSDSTMHYSFHASQPCPLHAFPTARDFTTMWHIIGDSIAPGAVGTGSAGYPVVPSGGDVDLVVTQTTESTHANAGAIGKFFVKVKNEGPHSASNVRFWNSAPANARIKRAYASGVSCSLTEPMVCNLGSVPSGQSKTVAVEVLVDANAMSSVINDVRARANQGDVNRGNNQDNRELKVSWAPDLSLQMTQSAAQINVGQSTTLTFQPYNGGPPGVSNAKLTVMLPRGLTFQSSSGASCNSTPATGTVKCNLGSFGQGPGPTVSLVVAATEPGTMIPTATLFASEPERNTDDNGVSGVLHVGATVDLSVSHSASASTVTIGDLVTYTVTVTNSAQALTTATGVRLTSEFQRGSAVQSVQGARCGHVGVEGVLCELDPIAPGQSRSVTIVGAAGPIGGVTHNLRVTSLEGDTNPANNAATMQTSVQTRSCSPRPPVRVSTLAVGPDMLRVDVQPGAAPGATANQVNLVQFGPTGNPTPMTNAEVDIDGVGGRTGVFDITFHRSLVPTNLRFFVRRVTPGQSAFVPFRVSDDCGGWNTFVGGGASPWGAILSLQAASSPSAPRVGDTMTYTLSVQNGGEHNSDSTRLVNTIPNGTTFVSATPTQGTCSVPEVVVCELGRLDPSQSASVTVVVSAVSVGETANWTYVTSQAHDAGQQPDEVIIAVYINPTSPPPNTLPGQRPAPTPSGTPATFPGARPNDPSSGQPSVLPGSR